VKLKTLFARFKAELAVWRAVWRDPRTPRVPRWLLGLALAYAVTPFDIIPDFIPVLGQLDDVIIIPLLVWCAWKLTPAVVITDARAAGQPTLAS
jgi:uncharacterized membrane protein YkvA (DUF1232 family)